MKLFLEDTYPQDFSFSDLKSERSYLGKLKYAEKYLKKIGSGSSRVVYKIDDEKVLKLAKNKKGLAQNKLEIDLYDELENTSSILAKIFDRDENNLWVEMELAKKMTNKKFEELAGFKLDDMYNFFYGRKINRRIEHNLSDEIFDTEIFMDLQDLVFGYNVSYGDLSRLSSWGVVIRDGEETPVLVDFGLNEKVHYEYYRINK